MEFSTKKDEKNFLNDIITSITRSCNLAINNCNLLGNSLHEPDVVAYIIKQLPNDLYNALHAYCPKIDFSVAGVYCHQKPLADFGTKPCPEIGDLLLVYLEESEIGIIKCNALLMQAKMVKGDNYRIYSSETHQLKLYKDWPKFVYKRAGSLNGIIRDIIPKTINTGAKYLMLKEPYNDEKLIGCAVPAEDIVFSKKLSDSILDLLKFSTGRTFEYTHPVEDDWTNMIWDLISIAKNKKFRRKNSGIVGEDRIFIEIYGDGTDMGFEYIEEEQHSYNDYESEDNSIVPMILIKGKYFEKFEQFRSWK